MTRFDVINFISHGVSKSGADEDRDVRGAGDDEHEGEGERESEGDGDGEDGAPKLSPAKALRTYAINLTERAAQGKIDPLIGRKNEIERSIHILLRRRKNNPVYVGEAGVGKTALAEGLALAVHEGRVPPALKDVQIFALDMGALLAGTRFRGDFEQRLKAVIKAATGNPRIVLFIDEIHTIVGAGSASGSTMDASNLLKPALASGELRCIGSTTYQEYKRSFDRDKALARRFQRIDVAEPTQDEAIQILNGLKSYYEKHHNVRYTAAAMRAAVELSARYINDRYLPDKAIDVMDEAGVAAHLRAKDGATMVVGARDAERTVARMAKIPERSVSSSDRSRLQNLEGELKQVVYGQDTAIEAVCRAIKLARSGLAHPDRPVGAFLFAGPTGVGKTEVARQLAKVMGVEFHPLRHVGVHGAAYGVAADRRASRLCRLRPGRPADRRHQQDPALRAAARRDREGPSRPLQYPAAGDGPCDADRQQRPQGRLPQRDYRDDHQRRRAGTGARDDRLRRRGRNRFAQGCDRADVLAGIPQPAFGDYRIRRR